MATSKRLTAGAISVVLVVVYSVIMMATDGAASWAWLILVAAIGSLVVAARSEKANAAANQNHG